MRTKQSKKRLISIDITDRLSPKGPISAIAVQLLWGWRHTVISRSEALHAASLQRHIAMPAYADIADLPAQTVDPKKIALRSSRPDNERGLVHETRNLH
jgi:hypothetical protein